MSIPKENAIGSLLFLLVCGGLWYISASDVRPYLFVFTLYEVSAAAKKIAKWMQE